MVVIASGKNCGTLRLIELKKKHNKVSKLNTNTVRIVNPISHGVFDRDIFMGGGLEDPQPKIKLNLV